MFKKNNDETYTKYCQIKIEGNEELINLIEKEFIDGTNTKPESISEMLTKMWNREANDNSINDSIEKQSRKDGSSGELFDTTRKEQFNRFRPNSETSNENSNVKDNRGRTLSREQQK